MTQSLPAGLNLAGKALTPGEQRSWWLREALEDEGEASECPALRGDVDADVAIVGGGYTGLWTAYFLTERNPDLKVVVLEQDICGGGPSGRNGGFASGWWDELDGLVTLYGPEASVRACRATARSRWSCRAARRPPGFPPMRSTRRWTTTIRASWGRSSGRHQ